MFPSHDPGWYSLPVFNQNEITFLNESYKLNDNINGLNDLSDLHKITNEVKPEMSNKQIGFLSIPKGLHYDGMVDEWKVLCEKIKNSKDIREGLNRQCEQMSLSLLVEINNMPFSFLKRDEKFNDKNIIESLYWSCRGKGNAPGQHQRLLKDMGW